MREKVAEALEKRFIKSIENSSGWGLDELLEKGLKLPAKAVWLSYADAILEVI